jgi:hypothetical protein
MVSGRGRCGRGEMSESSKFGDQELGLELCVRIYACSLCVPSVCP